MHKTLHQTRNQTNSHPPRTAPAERRWHSPLLHLTVLFGVLGSAQLSAGAPPTLLGKADARDKQAWQFEVTLPEPAPTLVTCDEVGGDRERHQKLLPEAARQTVTLRGLKADTRYRCFGTLLQHTEQTDERAVEVHRTAPDTLAQKGLEVVRNFGDTSLITAPLPFDLKSPQITVPSADVSKTGYTMYNYGQFKGGFTNNYLVIADAKGQIRWYQPGPGAGDIDATYLGDDRILYGGMSATYMPPTIIGLDKVVEWTGTTATSSPYERPNSTNHDAGMSEDGASVFHMAYATMDNYYLVFIVKQIDIATNKVIWTWNSITDGRDKGELPPGTSTTNSDLYHANSIDDQWENGRLYLYVNMRNLSKVIKIDYLTKQVVWQLGVGGDFTLLEKDGTPAANSRWFFNEHDVKLIGPNKLSAYDNGSERSKYGGTNYSRALQLELDQVNMTARITFEYQEAGWMEPYWGGYDVLSSGNSLIALGHYAAGNSALTSGLIELDPAGTVVWRADFRNSKDAIYRADRIGGCDIFDNITYCPPRGILPAAP